MGGFATNYIKIQVCIYTSIHPKPGKINKTKPKQKHKQSRLSYLCVRYLRDNLLSSCLMQKNFNLLLMLLMNNNNRVQLINVNTAMPFVH